VCRGTPVAHHCLKGCELVAYIVLCTVTDSVRYTGYVFMTRFCSGYRQDLRFNRIGVGATTVPLLRIFVRAA
jgi:hypothetical protein